MSPLGDSVSPLRDVRASEAGFRWPAEWEKHDATWIAWPHNLDTWPNRFENIPKTFERMIRILAEVEKVHVLGGPEESYEHAVRSLSDCSNIEIHRVESNDCWIRDYGPTFVVHRERHLLAGIDWRYNAWGGKWPPFDSDAANAGRICEALGCKRFESSMVCEGGSLETDGAGTLLTTSRCLLSMSRNPDRSRAAVERELEGQLGVERVLWIDGGELEGDDTDSHIDQLVRFIRPGLVVAAVSYSSDDENAPKLEKQLACLEGVVDARGKPLDIVKLPTPPPRFIQSERVPESYCNFYFANEIVLVPTFGFRETDEDALHILRELLPERRIVPLDASDLIWGRGAFHCATQQQPATA
jgi:agmatine deiminase